MSFTQRLVSNTKKIQRNNIQIIPVFLLIFKRLPRCEMVKELFFTPRIISFNESFVPAGENNNTYPIAVIWHEGIAGRKKEDIISTSYIFFLKMRDAENRNMMKMRDLMARQLFCTEQKLGHLLFPL